MISLSSLIGSPTANHTCVPALPAAETPGHKNTTVLLHLVDGLLREVDRLARHQAAADAALERMAAKIEILEAELTLRNPGAASPQCPS